MIYTSENIEKILTSKSGKRLLTYIAPIYGQAAIALYIFNAIGTEIDDLQKSVEEIKKQTHPMTATWSLSYWEKMYDIIFDSTLSIEERQIRLVSTMQSRGQMNPYKLGQISLATTGLESRIEERTGQNKFTIWLLGKITNEDKLRKAINKAKPAHLIFDIKYEQIELGEFYFVGVIQTYKNFTVRQVN